MQKQPSTEQSVPTAAQPIDPSVVRKVVGDDHELIEDLFAEFLPGAKAGIAEIEQAACSGVAEHVRRASHKLKGACALVGAGPLIALCQQLEAAANGEDGQRILSLTAELDLLMKDVELASQTFLRQIRRAADSSP